MVEPSDGFTGRSAQHSPEWHVLKAEDILMDAPSAPGNNPITAHARVALALAHLRVAEEIRKYNL